MKSALFLIVSLAMLITQVPAFATVRQTAAVHELHPISSLIGDWEYFRSHILAKTRRYDAYSDINPRQLTGLDKTLVGRWHRQSNPMKPGYRLRTQLELTADHQYRYQYVVMSGDARQEWHFSGRWEVKDQILMLLIQHSTYPGENEHAVLFWRVLHLGQTRLVLVKTGANEMLAMTRVRPGSG
jgi:hypothetical protein